MKLCSTLTLQSQLERALGSEENCVCMFPIVSEMAGPIGQKTWWDDRGHEGERPREG